VLDASIAAAAKSLKGEVAVIDGEAIVFDSNGLPDFQQFAARTR
jgi:ATP-dependent DNA ligase